jgi:hypothetical protein
MTNTGKEADPRPQPPREPHPDECCRSGCEPCVYDLYWQALERYEEALRRWEGRERPLDKS